MAGFDIAKGTTEKVFTPTIDNINCLKLHRQEALSFLAKYLS